MRLIYFEFKLCEFSKFAFESAFYPKEICKALNS